MPYDMIPVAPLSGFPWSPIQRTLPNMPLDDSTKLDIRKRMDQYCDEQVPAHAKGDFRLSWRFWKDSVILYEERKTYAIRSHWTKMKVARIIYEAELRGWTLWAYDRNDKPMYYMDLAAGESLETVLAEIAQDPTGIFWG